MRAFGPGTKYRRSLAKCGNKGKNGCKSVGKIGKVLGKILYNCELITIFGLLAVPCIAPILSTMVMVFMVEWWDGGREDMIIVEKCVVDMVEPILVKLSKCS